MRGYKIPFEEQPPPRATMEEPHLSDSQAKACDVEIARLSKKGAIEAVTPTTDQFLSSFFLREKPSGGVRFILNLKALNRFIQPPHFKLEDWRTVVQLMLPESWMATIDLEDAYLLVPVDRSHRKYLRFQWRGATYQFTALPFGLATSPFIFTKIIRPVTTKLREEGLQSVVYLDDFLLLGATEKECSSNVKATVKLLTSLGFIINYKKSEPSPAKTKKFLGIVFDSSELSMSIPHERRAKLRKQVYDMSKKSECRIRDLASMIGSLVSIFRMVKYGQMYTRNFERIRLKALEASQENYSARTTLPSSLGDDFSWWIKVLSNQNQRNIISSDNYALEIFSDASRTGWGASCQVGQTHGFWSNEEKALHINALELIAAYNGLCCFASNLTNCDLLLRIDNMTAIAYINKFGSVQYPHLSSIARKIWKWCEDRNIFIFVSYIASADNATADAESRTADPNTEWEISPKGFSEINHAFGPFHIDLFASQINAKCQAYASWLPDPKSTVVDAFTISWESLNFYAFPPFILIPRVLRKIINDRAEGTVVVPWWPSQAWFPLFCKLADSEIIMLNPAINLLSSPFRDRHPSWSTLSLAAARLSFSRLLRD